MITPKKENFVVIDLAKFDSRESIKHSPITVAVKDDTDAVLIKGKYPRGFVVLTGGTLTLWTPDTDTAAKKVDLGTVPDGFIWTFGSVVGIAETTTLDAETTAGNIIWIP